MNEKIGFIGLGRMGGPMAANLLKAGFNLCVFDIVPEAMESLVRAGAEAAESIADIAKNCGVIVTILPADQHILSVYAGEGGIIESADGPKLCIEMTSAMGSTVQEIARYAQSKGKDIAFVDAPVSGGVDGAAAGTLTIMCGGEKVDIERAMPFLNAMGKNMLYAGALGSGKAVKMINQMLNALNTAVAAEAMYLAKNLGVDMDLMLGIIGKSTGTSWVMQNNVPKFMLPKQYGTGFKISLMTKDLRLSVDEAARQGIDLPLAKQGLLEFADSVETLGGDVNYNAVGEWIERHNNG